MKILQSSQHYTLIKRKFILKIKLNSLIKTKLRNYLNELKHPFLIVNNLSKQLKQFKFYSSYTYTIYICLLALN